MTLPVLMASALLLISPRLAHAHPGHVGGFHEGWQHPLTGIDHLLAMIAVGLLAVRVGGRGLWLVPGAFLGAMLVGGLAAGAGWMLPGVELGIVASVVVLGAMIASASVAPVWLAAGIVAAFALFHGHAHGSEMAAGGTLASYALGFLLATAVLHLTGIAAAMGLAQLHRATAARVVGGAIAACGALMLMGWI